MIQNNYWAWHCRILFSVKQQTYTTAPLINVLSGFGIWGMPSHVNASAYAWNIGDMEKKSMSCLIKMARLKQRFYLSLSVKHKDLTRKSCVFIYFIGSVVKTVLSEAATRGVIYKKVSLKFAKFTGRYKCQSLFS